MSSCEVGTLPEPNLKEFSPEERRALGLKCYELSTAGRKDEADKLKREYPLTPEMADALKSINGIRALVESGLNLSRAVKAYGHDWLKS